MLDKKNIKAGNLIKLFINFIIYIFFTQITYAQTNNNFLGTNTDIKILDKISSKNELINLKNGEETIYKDLAIRVMRCTNSELDDNPEIKAYIQVRDLTKKDNDKGTIRKKYGISIDKNSVHGSDSIDNAKIEIDFFFKD